MIMMTQGTAAVAVVAVAAAMKTDYTPSQ